MNDEKQIVPNFNGVIVDANGSKFRFEDGKMIDRRPDEFLAAWHLYKAAPKMLEVLECVYHQLVTDSDLATITGTAKYRDLAKAVGEAIAEADPTNPQIRFSVFD